jgi:hypothetical protein
VVVFALAGLIVFAGCDRVFLDDRPVVADAAPDAYELPCTSAGIVEDYQSSAMPCGAWGFATIQQTTMTVTDGHMTVVPDPSMVSYGGCISAGAIAFPPSGLFVEVSSVLSSANAYQFLVLRAPVPTGAVAASITYGRGMIRLTPDADPPVQRPYDPVSMRWWRLRPDASRSSVVAELSSDGRNWDVLGAVPGVVPTSTRFEFGAGTFNASAANTGVATFDQVNVCP